MIVDIDEAFRAALNRAAESRGRGFQTKIAQKVGVSPQYIWKLLRQKSYGSEAVRRKIAAALGYGYEEFLATGKPIEDARAATSQLEHDRPEVRDLLEKTREVLLSGDPVMASALQSNILAFHQAVRNQREAQEDRKRADLNAKALQARIEDLEQKVSAGPPRQSTGTEGEI